MILLQFESPADLQRWLEGPCEHQREREFDLPIQREQCSGCRWELDRIVAASKTFAEISAVAKELNLGAG